MIRYFLLSGIAFLGFVAGIIIGEYTKGEYSAQNKYYQIMLQAICLILGIIVILGYDFSLLNLFLVLAGLIAGFFLYKFLYLFLGIILALGYGQEVSYILFSLVFILGLPVGTLLRERIIKNALFVLLIFALSLMTIFIPQGEQLGLFAGASLLSLAVRKELARFK